MKLLYISDSPLTSKKANIIQVLHMCYAFSKLGHDVILAVPAEGYNSDANRKLVAQKMNKDVPFVVETYPKFTINGRFSTIGGYMGIRKILKKQDFDYCLVRNPVLMNATIKYNIPTIFESHNSLLHEKYRLVDLFRRKKLIQSSKSHYLIKFITISNALANVWKSRGVPSEKILVLHDGVEVNNFSADSERDPILIRKELNLPLDKKIVVYAGSLYVNRGIENIQKLAELFPQTLFLVLGGSEERKKYYVKSSLEQHIDNIVFKGYVLHHKIRDYLIAADVLLMIWTKQVKTINYCSPLKMFEYMAAGRIIVGHGFPTIKEVLIDGETAYLADPDSFNELSEKLNIALEETYPSIIADNARKLAFKQYSWDKRAREILKSINLSCTRFS